MISTDLGIPLTVENPITTIGKIYLDIADKLIHSIILYDNLSKNEGLK